MRWMRLLANSVCVCVLMITKAEGIDGFGQYAYMTKFTQANTYTPTPPHTHTHTCARTHAKGTVTTCRHTEIDGYRHFI